MTRKPKDDGWTSFESAVSRADLLALIPRGHIEKLSIRNAPLLRADVAQGLRALAGVTWLWLWCDVARPAMKHLLATRGLEKLDMLTLKGPGKLPSFAVATELKEFRCNHYLTAADLSAIADSPSLREVGVQRSAISPATLQRLLDMPRLESLDLEGTRFDDAMAQQVSRSRRLLALDVGATRLTGAGLAHLCRMPQLRSLDIWANRLDQDDLELLSALPQLEYLSLGPRADAAAFDADRLLDQLAAIRPLKRVWLDGIALDRRQQASLQKRYAYVRL